MILITGATGFIGQNLLKALLGKKIPIRCLVRDKKKIKENSGLEIVEGDLRDKERLFEATKNVDIVIHLAAVIKSLNSQDFTDVNVKGTRNLTEACLKNKVKEIIYVSSLDACLTRTNFYGESKALAERVIVESSINYVILRPAFVYGKESEDIVTLKRLVQRLPFIPVIGNGKAMLQPIYVEDVCDIIVRFVENGVKNKIYYLAGEERISVDGFIDKIASYYLKKVIKVHIPSRVIFFPLRLMSFVIKNPALNFDSLKLSNRNKVCDISEIKGQFNVKFLNLEKGIAKALIKDDACSGK